jgi:hypothetical protein
VASRFIFEDIIMINQWIEQLQSPDPQQRRQAIVALANARNPMALKALAAVYRGDPDTSLRDLALQAGRYIRQETGQAPGAPPGASTGPSAGTAPGPGLPPRTVSKRDSELAKFYLDAATNYLTLSDKGRAVEHLGKALSLNPALTQDTFVTNLILMATGLPVDQALPQLTHPDRREDLVRRAGGRRPLERQSGRKEGWIAKATWDNVAIDFLIYWLIISISIAAVFLLILNILQEWLDEMAASSPGATTVDLEALLAASAISLIIVSVFYGIIYTLSLAVQGAAIHAAATYILGGDGKLRYLYHRLVPFQTWTTFGMVAAMTVFLLAGQATDIFFLMPLVLIVAFIGVCWYTIELISQVYQFGWWSGCGSMIIAGILLSILSAITNTVMFTLIEALLG